MYIVCAQVCIIMMDDLLRALFVLLCSNRITHSCEQFVWIRRANNFRIRIDGSIEISLDKIQK